jgi:hypothetical protein
VNGDAVKVNFLSVAGSGANQLVKITLVDARIADQNTLKGSYYYMDSEIRPFQGPLKRPENEKRFERTEMLANAA